jgi:stage 0 sporulation regulatory protein
MYDTDQLLKRIELLRNKMSTVALKQGITSLESIALSQELDRLLNIYEKKRENEIDATNTDKDKMQLL